MSGIFCPAQQADGRKCTSLGVPGGGYCGSESPRCPCGHPASREVVMVLLALMQASAVVLDVKANCAAMEEAACKASDAGAQLLLTPELFPVGYAPRRLRSTFDPGTLPALRETLAGI